MRARVSTYELLTVLLPMLYGAIGGAGCVREIELDAPQVRVEALAIRGVLRSGEQPIIIVDISTLAGVLGAEGPKPVEEASVVLLDDQNRGVDVPMKEPGHYELLIVERPGGLEVQSGKWYQLSVATPDGRNYLSGIEPLLPVPEPTFIDQTGVVRTVINEAGNFENRQFLRFLITTPIIHPDLPGRSYLKWDFLGTYKFTEPAVNSAFPPPMKTCYIFEALSPQKVVVFDGSENSQDLLSGFFLLEEPLDYRFSEGFYLTVFQQSLSPGAYRYWKEVGRVSEVSGNFFDAPPGKVTGNFRNVDDPKEEVFGYFFATGQAVMRLYMPPATGQFTPLCPELVQPDEEGLPAICLDCLARPGSTTVKPDFWEG